MMEGAGSSRPDNAAFVIGYGTSESNLLRPSRAVVNEMPCFKRVNICVRLAKLEGAPWTT